VSAALRELKMACSPQPNAVWESLLRR
jgi:hypothetical protein